VRGPAIKKFFSINLRIRRFSLCRGIDRPRENGEYYILLNHFEVSAVAQNPMDFSKKAVPL